jgi:cytochrome c peroxidase
MLHAGSATLPLFFGLFVLAASGFAWRLPPGFPAPRVPKGNPVTAEKVALGHRLFYDVRLSGSGTQACASCHQQARAFTDARARAMGSTAESHPRSAMSLANVAYGVSLTWTDAGHRSLEDQMLVPLLADHPVEMGLAGRGEDALSRLGIDPLYSKLFSEAFPGEKSPVSLGNVQKAIASFERTILSGDSPYDRLVWKDERGALSDSARRGMALFFSDRIACAKCHSGFTFSGPVDWEGGPAPEPTFHDIGLGGRFRAPTLRNVAVTAPYMHDGRFATLGDVIDHYATGGAPSPGKSDLMKGFVITSDERADLIAFLESLTDVKFLANPLLSDPWLN